ncbi:hypothetical protein QQ045_031130 [Rhodiola kirilowii]
MNMTDDLNAVSDELKPHVGMTFSNLDQAALFYKEYARIARFVVRLATTNRSDEIITIKYLVCQRKGFKQKCKVVDTINTVDHNDRSKRDTRCGCQAKLQVNIAEGGATVTDYKNFKRDLKLYIGLNDAQMVVDNLSNKIKTCPRYNLVFVPFTGVDNQLRSVTLAAGLISKEDVDSYTWLLTCFKKLLERDPSVIVTAQDAAIKAAIATIFPSSRHRFCMWHITKKIAREAYGCAIQSINEDETGRMHIINNAGRNTSRTMLIALKKFHDHIYEYVKEHAPFGGAHCSSSKGDYFRAVLQMPQPANVVVNNPGLSRNKGCGKKIRGPREIAIEISKKPLRSCGYCNELGLHDKRTCPKRVENDSRMRGATSEHVDVNFAGLDNTYII